MTEITLTAPQGTKLGSISCRSSPSSVRLKGWASLSETRGTGESVFHMKGADTVMSPIVQYNDWLMDKVDNMAREGLRTLVVSKKTLMEEQYADFEQRFQAAKFSVVNRSA